MAKWLYMTTSENELAIERKESRGGVLLTKVDPQLAGKITKAGQKGLGVLDPVSNKQHKVEEEEYVIIREVVENYLEKQVNGGSSGADTRHVGGKPESDAPLLEKLAVNLAPSQAPTQTNAASPEAQEANSAPTDPTPANETPSSQAAIKSGRRCLLPISKAMQPQGSPSGPFLVEGLGARPKEGPGDDKELVSRAGGQPADGGRTGRRSPGRARAIEARRARSTEGLLTVEKVARASRSDGVDSSGGGKEKTRGPTRPKASANSVSPQVKSPREEGPRKASRYRLSYARDDDNGDASGVDDSPLRVVSERSTLRGRSGTRSGTTNAREEASAAPVTTTSKSLNAEGRTKTDAELAPNSPRPPTSPPPPPQSPAETKPPNPRRRRRGGGEGSGRRASGGRRGVGEPWQTVVSRHGLTSDPPDSAVPPAQPPRGARKPATTLQPVEGRGYVSKTPSKVALNVVLPREIKSRESRVCSRNHQHHHHHHHHSGSGGYGVSTGAQQHLRAWLARVPSPPPPPPPPSAPSVGNKALDDEDDDDDEAEARVPGQRPVPADDGIGVAEPITDNAAGKQDEVLGEDGSFVDSEGDGEQEDVIQDLDSPRCSADANPGGTFCSRSESFPRQDPSLPYVQAFPPSWHPAASTPAAGKGSSPTGIAAAAAAARAGEHAGRSGGERNGTPAPAPAAAAPSERSAQPAGDATPPHSSSSSSSEPAGGRAGKAASGGSPAPTGNRDVAEGPRASAATDVGDALPPRNQFAAAGSDPSADAAARGCSSPRSSISGVVADRVEGPERQRGKRGVFRQYTQPRQQSREQPPRRVQPPHKQQGHDRKTSDVSTSAVYMAATWCELLGPQLCKDCDRASRRSLFSAYQDLLYPSIHVSPRSLVGARGLKGDNFQPEARNVLLPVRRVAWESGDGDDNSAPCWRSEAPALNLDRVVTDLDICKRIMARAHKA